MKKLFILLTVGTLLISGTGVFSMPMDKISVKISTISFSKPIIKNEGEFVNVELYEANTFLIKKGKPMLPSYTKIFTFPFKTQIKSVTCNPINIETLKNTMVIKQSPTPKILSQIVATNQKESIDYGLEPYPSNWFSYDVGCGLYNGELSVILKVVVNPVKYHPQEKIIEWAKDVDIVIQYEEQIEQLNSREQYKLLIIAPDEYYDEIAPLITHKIERGITTKFAGLDQVYGGTGIDNQEKIKYYIKDAIENWATSNVLLIGSNTKLPGRVTHVQYENEDNELFVSDLYFADIFDSNGDFCSWDSNGNNLYGEYNWSQDHNYDDIDLFPDVNLGRLACRSESEVITVVNKIINYENNEAYLQNWFKNLVVCGGDSFPHDVPEEDVDEGEYSNQMVIDLLDDFTATKLWVTNGKLTGWTPTGVQNIKDAIDNGCGFVDFCGHGNTNVWATHPHLDFNTWVPTPANGIYNTNILTLANGDKLPIVTVEACSTAKFAQNENCFNWAFMYNTNGGAIGTFGATGLGWSYTGNYTHMGLIGKMGLDTYRTYKLEGSTTLGEVWGRALNRYILECSDFFALDCKTIEEWILFGDPTLQIAFKPESGAPIKPIKPIGSISGVPGIEYTYTTSTTDPDNDQIYYLFDWGDGTNSGWIGPFDSGATASANHNWGNKNTFLVKVQANDTNGKVSEWSDPLSVTIPRSKIIVNSLFSELIENFNNIFQILQKLIYKFGQ